jgi:hypothetical protein
LLNSCTQKPISTDAKDFQLVIDSAQDEYDNGKPYKAVAHVDSVFGRYKNLDLQQRFDYYSINYNFNLHKSKNRQRAMLYAERRFTI